jgi:hypothetical protein
MVWAQSYVGYLGFCCVFIKKRLDILVREDLLAPLFEHTNVDD